MNTKISRLIMACIILLSFAIGIYFYPVMPLRMASHWGINGVVDGYISKFWGLFLMPTISIVMFLLFIAIPKIDPLKKNIEEFKKYYNGFAAIIIAFLFYIYLLTIFWNIGVGFNMPMLMVPPFVVLFYYAGVLTENAKTNWFIGIRTPWTLSSEHVWRKTHKLGGKLFKISALISLFGLIFKPYAFYLVIIPAIAVAIFTILYSYFEYRKEKSAK